MIQTTTNAIDGRTVSEYLGVVTGEAILGANIVRDLFAGVRDIVGGRSGAYEEELRKAMADGNSETLLLRGDKKVMLGSAVDIMSIAKRAGAKRALSSGLRKMVVFS